MTTTGIVQAEFLIEGNNGRVYKYPVTMNYTGTRIEFVKSPFALKDEIKAMAGSRWHGSDTENPRKIWSVLDTGRNRFQIEWLTGGDPYAWFDRPLQEFTYPKFGSESFGYRDLMSQQRLMANTGLTYHYQIWAAEMGTGKTLSAIAMMLLSQMKGFWWVGPKSSLYAMRHEFERWGLPSDVCPDLMSYEGMIKRIKEWNSGDKAPIGVIFDEAHNLKTPTTQRSQCARVLADAIRNEHDKNGFVILMTGTPSPKSPGDWWSLCEIAWPGFIKEGSREAFERRLGFFRLRDNLSGHAFNTRIAWKDNEARCDECGQFLENGHHILEDGSFIEEDREFNAHTWTPSNNEVADLYDRLNGLVTIVHKKNCLDLPDKIYKEVICEPKPSLLRVAGAIVRTAKNVITGLTQLRELSDGFQYRDVEDGYDPCPACKDGMETHWYHPNDPGASIYEKDLLDPGFVAELKERTIKCRRCNGSTKIIKYKRISKEVPCPKIDALVDLMDHNYEQGRMVVFAGFTGSLDRIVKVAQKEGWNTIRIDGRGWKIERLTGKPNPDGSVGTETVKLANPLEFWYNKENERVLIVAHPKSGGVSMNLCPQGDIPGATMAVFYSNDYDPASRSQAEDRIHRNGMDIIKGATIVDLFHLPTDRRVRDVLQQNRKLELMSMGDFKKDYDDVKGDDTDE